MTRLTMRGQRNWLDQLAQAQGRLRRAVAGPMPLPLRRLVLAVLTTATVLALPAAAHAACPAQTTCEDVWFDSAYGVRLHADVIKPAGSEGRKLPVILSIGPYFAHAGQQGAVDYDPLREGPSERFKDLWDDG